MITLAIDTAAHLCAACIYDSVSDEILGKAVEDIGRGHAERLFPVIELAMDEAGLTFDAVQRLGVCIGPGSFTGVRVGVAAMRGLSLALSVPLAGVTVFEGLALSAPKKRPLLILLDARRGEVYAQLFDRDGIASGPPAAIAVDAARKLAHESKALLMGSGAPLVCSVNEEGGSMAVIRGDAATADIEAIARLAAAQEPQHEQPKPLYLRSADAKPQVGFAVPRRDTAP
ncbi:tRNA (adenosine(37)-N6)-threonylcarbamoyltransferase complex dimerization subunit type 1 TsaB [Hoeflea sp. TYP-13]|uniref:tRNA (adenosine(37)-N6)-threonylcarbamoyltransferase complex dimerization subunit type 1 TsaB n=1 Tax=Hoeflea sp. TYP-13 TaxID=3230023 RepID=UPI0034C63345